MGGHVAQWLRMPGSMKSLALDGPWIQTRYSQAPWLWPLSVKVLVALSKEYPE